ncbi:DUF3576 domain-containing protein [Thalassorhabdomicrobium marinisediminis]|uniref:DUF3576 domain-containing protein n=1 Tax=Thalassorhabdomicrobium marinisediminis TaxID=2170577 RepID=A0A2T7G073_9RHOB|nr:DUF3576 domain-containing protein [Thalassorhabdomicrobium marinisediminis]PVA07819.1 DUF3576 domain-containing protein [Thalassorhabdomicrobium marinisediminis]
MTNRSRLLRAGIAAGLALALGACGGSSSPFGSLGSLGSRNAAEPQTAARLANPFLYKAALDVLGVLPVQSADPATGRIVTGYGTPPGGARAYRATVVIDSPILDARSLNLALFTRNGPASAQTTRAVEDAILSRTRQLRIAAAAR